MSARDIEDTDDTDGEDQVPSYVEPVGEKGKGKKGKKGENVYNPWKPQVPPYVNGKGVSSFGKGVSSNSPYSNVGVDNHEFNGPGPEVTPEFSVYHGGSTYIYNPWAPEVGPAKAKGKGKEKGKDDEQVGEKIRRRF